MNSLTHARPATVAEHPGFSIASSQTRSSGLIRPGPSTAIKIAKEPVVDARESPGSHAPRIIPIVVKTTVEGDLWASHAHGPQKATHNPSVGPVVFLAKQYVVLWVLIELRLLDLFDIVLFIYQDLCQVSSSIQNCSNPESHMNKITFCFLRDGKPLSELLDGVVLEGPVA